MPKTDRIEVKEGLEVLFVEERAWERRAAILICVALGLLGAALLFRYLFAVLLPFLIAWGISTVALRATERISARLGLSHRLCAVVALLLFLSLAIVLLCRSFNSLMEELRRMLAELLANGGVPRFWGATAEAMERLMGRLGLLEAHGEAYAEFCGQLEALLSRLGREALQSLSQAVPGLAARVASALPSVLLAVLVTVIASFYFCMEPTLLSHLLNRLPRGVGERVRAWKEALKSASWGYLRAYLLLLLLTVLELLIGFWILRVEYAFLLACVIAFLDMLPVLGVGTVLIPWAIVALVQGNRYLGFGMLILYFAVFILRQIMEPRLIGRSLGLHPLAALLAGYAGWRLFGFWGMALGPIAALLFKTLFTKKRKG